MNNILWEPGFDCVNYKFTFCSITEDDVRKTVKSLSIFKASSVPDISSKVLKDAFLVLVPQLTYLCNLSINMGIVPQKWKIATIIPLQKEGDATDVNNLRPVSLLPVPGKILEKLLHAQLISYLESNNVLIDTQGGFRRGHSTIATISEFTDDIFKAIDDKKVTLSVFIDLKKAFDTVNHDILLKKLERLGLDVFAMKWMKDYLTNRYQRTLANNILSDTCLVRCGVPQGSILGPLLFLVFINDMIANCKSCKSLLYADDTVMYQSCVTLSEAERLLQGDLIQLGDWCNKNKLTINVKKTKVMIFGSQKKIKSVRHPCLKMNDKVLEVVQTYKYLGMTLDSSLTFTNHIKKTIKSIAHKVYILSKVRKYITKAATLTLLKTMVLPFFDYGDYLYESGGQNYLLKLQRLLNRALRLVFNNSNNLSVKQLHVKSNLLPLNDRRNVHILQCMFQRAQKSRYVDNRNLLTRAHGKKLLLVNMPRTEKYKKSVAYKGAIAWNNLSLEAQTAESYEAFKLKCKNTAR